MKSISTAVLTCLILGFSAQKTFAQYPIPEVFDTTFVDTDGNTHLVSDYFAEGKSVFIMRVENYAQAYLGYESVHLTDLYNTYGQGGSNDVVVLLYAAYGFETYDDLSGLDYSDQLGPGYENVSYTEDNPVPIILASDNYDIMLNEGAYLALLCTDDKYLWVSADTPDGQMQVLTEQCCTPYDTFDPGLETIYINPDCNPTQVNFRYVNDAPSALDSISVGVWLNETNVDQFILPDTLQGCESINLSYQNDLFGEGDEVVLAITEPNQPTYNDTVSMDISSVDSVYGHLRLSIINPGSNTTGIAVNDTYTNTAVIDATNGYFAEYYLGEGCHEVTFGIYEENNPVPESMYLAVAVDENEMVTDTLVYASLNVDYFMTERNIYSQGAAGNHVWGYVFQDTNLSQIRETGEPGIEGIAVTHAGVSTFTDSTGYYNLPGSAWDSTGISYDEGAWPIYTTPNAGNGNGDSQINFGLSSDDPVWDLGFFNIPSVEHLCWTSAHQDIHIVNQGNQPTEGELLYVHDPLLTPTAYLPLPETVSGDSMTFAIPEVGFNEQYSVTVYYDIDTSLFGEFVDSQFTLWTLDSSGAVVNTVSTSVSDSLFCSYDPNEIVGYPKGDGAQGLIPADTHLDYRIRFQNTGNYAAMHVEIKDTLPANLDLSQFAPGYSSHPCQTYIDHDTRVVTWVFSNINLPDSASDPEGSQGSLYFAIDPEADLEPGDVIATRAHIYFDSNDPIATNTSLHTIAEPLAADHASTSTETIIYPNPATDHIMIRTSISPGSTIKVTDLRGRIIDGWLLDDSAAWYDVGNLDSGIYLLTITDEHKRVSETKKLLVSH